MELKHSHATLLLQQVGRQVVYVYLRLLLRVAILTTLGTKCSVSYIGILILPGMKELTDEIGKVPYRETAFLFQVKNWFQNRRAKIKKFPDHIPIGIPGHWNSAPGTSIARVDDGTEKDPCYVNPSQNSTDYQSCYSYIDHQ